jgi:hypothetical protein
MHLLGERTLFFFFPQICTKVPNAVGDPPGSGGIQVLWEVSGELDRNTAQLGMD